MQKKKLSFFFSSDKTENQIRFPEAYQPTHFPRMEQKLTFASLFLTKVISTSIMSNIVLKEKKITFIFLRAIPLTMSSSNWSVMCFAGD